METTAVTAETTAETTTSATVDVAIESLQEQVDRASGFFSKSLEYFKSMLPLIIVAVVLLALGYLITKLVCKIIEKAMGRSKVDNAAKNFLISVIRVLLYTVVVIMALSVLKVPISSIITILGAAGLAVSLALQTCLSNLAGGFIILFSKPFSSGDTVEIDNTVGTVQSISILYTKIYTFDGKTVFIPNGKVSDAKVINYTETPARRIDLSFSISYSSDFEKARECITSVLNGNKLIMKEPAAVIRMSGHGESSVNIDVLAWVNNADYLSTRYDIIEGVKASFDANGIEIPFNQLDVHIVK
ncbi:MAG: mechanosensitive ion channel [Ruminococcus sp.]|nr:mechanosensitive ion channel [Ruminococcus sp.]